MKRNKYIFVALAGAALVVASCTDFDDYNEAYTGDPGTSIGQTLWQNIEGNAELSDFMSILDKAGYRQRLQGSQFYTVWAPLNGTFDAAAIAAHDSTWIAQRFINSHIANYNYQATGELNRRVHTLNEKSFVLAGNSSAYTYDGHDMVSVNIPTSNGTLHTINGFAEYFPNVYEYIFDVDGCDSISPTVPPISVMTTSYFPLLPSRSILLFISSVICGTICTVLPRYAPSLSRLITV